MLRSLMSLFLILGLVLPSGWTLSVQAQDATPPAADNAASGLNLDLGSTDRSVAASTVLSPTASATINLGGLNRVVSAADMLTAAEFVAVRQVMNTGTQYLQLNDMGAAIGGGMRLNANLASQINSLVIPTNVHASQNAAVLQTLNLAGNFSNSGIYSIMSTNSAVSSAAINASNIYNNAGGLIQSTLANLTLSAVNNIVNAGTITSAGNLNLTAGGAISNIGQLAVMQAMNNMNLQAANIVNQGTMLAQLGNMNAVTANLVNSGLMQSLSQSLTVQNLSGSVLNVTGTGGVMSALKSLSFVTQGPQYDSLGNLLEKPAINLEGGNLTAENVNFTTPSGVVRVHAQRIDGGVNIVGGIANVGTSQGNLFIESQLLTGDPIYYAQGGDLDLSGNFNIATGGDDFIGLASGSIIAPLAPVNPTIDTSGVGTGNIVLAAGVDFTVSGGASPVTCADCSLLYTITQASGTGGDVNLPTVALITDIGNVSIQAHAGTAASGNISIQSINATASGADVSLSASGDVDLGSASSFAGNNFSVAAGGNISTAGSIDATVVSMITTGGAGNIALGAAVTALGNMNLYASGNGVITQTAGVLTANLLTITSDLSDIGASGQSINISVNALSANGANVYIANNSAALQLNSSSADNHSGTYGTFELTTTGFLELPSNMVLYGGTIDVADGNESTINNGALVESFGSSGSVSWKTVNFLHNDGEILGHYVLINSDFDLNVDGSGTIGISDMPNSGTTLNGPQSLVSLESLSGGNVTVSQGRIDGLIASSEAVQGAFSFACFCFVASFINDGTPSTNFNVTVSQGALYANHILATNQVNLTNNGGDIRIYGQTGWSPGIISTSGVGDINLTTTGSYTILLDRGASINSSNNLTLNTSYFYNNTSPTFMAGNPAVHAVNDITLQNLTGDLGVSGTGGMWTGIAGVEGTGTINFNAPTGSVIVTSAILMGTTNISASITSGLFLLDLADSTNFTAGSMVATAPSGLPLPFSATYGTTGITYWQAPSSVNMIDPDLTQGGGLLVLSTVAAVDPLNPTGDTLTVLINGDPVVGGPTGVTFPVSCGGSCVNYTSSGMEILSTLQIDGLQTGLMVVHANMPVTVNGDTSISNTGGTALNTSTVGVLQTCDLCAGPSQPGITINSTAGNLSLGGGRGGFTSQPNLVTLGALEINNSGGAFIEYGLVQGGSVSILGSSTRLYSGDIQSTDGDFVINNAGQIDIFNVAATGGGASIIHTGSGYIDMNFSSIISLGNLAGSDVSISIVDATANGGLIVAMGSNVFSNSGGAVEISISNGSIRTNTGAHIVSSGTLSITCDTCQDGPQFNDSTIGSFGNLNINNSDGDMTFRGSSVYTSNADVFITNEAGNLTFALPGAVRADQLIFVDTVFGTFPYSPYSGGNLTVSNAGGDLTVTQGFLLAGSDLIDGNVAVNNSGGNLNLSNFGSIQSPNGRVIVRNSGGNLSIASGGSVIAAGNGVSVDDTIMLYNTGGTVSVETLSASTALEGPNFALIMADQDISVTGLGINAFLLSQLNLISTAGAVQVIQQDLSSSPISGQAATSFSVTISNGSLLVDTILANNGSVTLSAQSRTTSPAGGSITINPGASIVAINGTVTIQTCTSGAINIGANAFITALDGVTGFNDIFIVSGTIPSTPVAGSTPANVVDSTASGGQIFYGTQGLTASAPDNFINAIGGDIVFDAASVTDITLGGNVTINASTAGISPLITSLDLQNDSAAVDQIVALQGLGLVGGALVVVSGAAVGGNAIISASRIAPLLTALNLPANVDIEFNDFGTILRPITVALTATSTTTQAIVAGTSSFSDTSLSRAYINVVSDQAGPVVVVDSSAAMVSDRLLSITANGGINVGGLLNAFDQLTVETVEGGGNIAVSSDMIGRNVLRLETDRTGDITQMAGTLTGNSIYLLARNGNVGTANARVSAISYDTLLSEVRILASGNAFLTYQGDVSLQRSLVGANGTLDLTTTCAGDIVIDGDYILGGTINLTADGSGGIFTTFNNNNFQADTINLVSGTGDIGGPNGPDATDLSIGAETGTITANTGGNVYIQMNGVILCLGCPSGSSDPRPQPPPIAPRTLNVGSSRAASILHISATNLGLSVLAGANISVAGDMGSGTPGDLTLTGANVISGDVRDMTIGLGATIDMAGGGVITLNANGLGSIQNNGQVSMPNLVGSSIAINASQIDGTGSLSGPVAVNASSVSLTQGSIDGVLSGNSFGGDFNVTVDTGLLLVGSIISAGNISLTNNSADIYLDNGSALDAGGGLGIASLTAGTSSSIVVRAGSTFNADTINFRMGVFQSAVLVNAATAINFNNTGDLTIGSYAGLTAPDVRFVSDNSTVVAGLPAVTGNLTVSAPAGATLIAIQDITNITSTFFTNDGVTPYAPATLVDTSGVDIYYDPSAVAQTFAGNQFIVLNAGPAAASVVMGSPILGGTITGDLTITNSDGNLVIYNNIPGFLSVTGNISVTNTGGDLTFTGLGGGSTFWLSGGDLSVTNTSGDLTFGLQFGMQSGGSQLVIDNQNGNTFIGFNSIIASNALTSVTNAGGRLHVGNAALVGGFGTGNTTLSNTGGILSCINCSMQTGPDQVLSLTNVTGNIFFNQAQLTVNPGTIIIDNTDGDIIITGNSTLSQSGAGLPQQIGITANSTGDITIRGSTIGGETVILANLGSGDIVVTNGAQVTALSGLQISSDSGDLVLKNTALVNNSNGDINYFTVSGGNLVATNGFSSTATGAIVFNTSGNVNINTGAGFTSTAANVVIVNTGSDVVIDTSPFAINGVVPVNPSTLVSVLGDVSITTAQALTITGSGNTLNAISAAGTVSLVSTTGSVSVLQNVLTSVVSGSAATTFAVTATDSDLNVGNISTNPGGLNPDGSITLIAGCVCPPAAATTLTVTTNSIITARSGNVILRNADVTQGSIFLDTNSEVNARQLGSSFGNVYIVVGTIPVNPVAGVTPANVISNPTLGGQVFFGANGLTGNAPDNIVNAPGTLVVFDAPGSGAITMNGNVEINSVPVITLTSLDLTDPTVTADILALIAQGDIGGNLIVNGSGVATGGSILITPGVLSVVITAENIPENVTIQFQGYSATDVLAINITAASTTQQVIISGTHEYIAGVGASEAVINVTSDQAGPVFQITGTGILISDGSLTITTTGGDFSSAGQMFVGGAASVISDAGVTLNNLTAGGNLTVTAQAGSITQTGFVDTSFTGANGNGGDITYEATTGISGVSLNALGGLTTGNGGTILVNTTSGSIAFSSFIDSAARGGGRGGNVTLTADQDITIRSVNAIGGLDPNVNARGGDILIQTTTGSLIATGASPRFVDSSGSQFSAGTSIADAGTITVITPGGIVGTGGALSFRAEGARGGGNGANIVITTSGTAELDFVSSSASTVSPLLTAAGDAGDVTITADGGMTLVDVRAQGGVTSGSGGDVNLTTSGGGVNVSLFIFANSPGTTGDGGSVTVNADNDVVIGNIGGLSISTFGGSLTGNSQTVSIDSANGSVSISGLTNTSVTTVGNAGAISVTAETGILSGGLSAAGGTTSGDGANVTAATNNGDLTITSFVSSRGKGQGNGGDVALTALNGSVAVLGTIATGAAIASNGGGTGDAGRIDILYGASTPFVIDPTGVGITNGARGSVTALATDSGDGNVVTIQNVNDDTLVTLNGTIDVTSASGTGGLIWFVGSTGFSTTVTGNSSGLINGELIGSGDNFALTLTRPDTALTVAAINSAGLISINNSVGTSSIVIPLGANMSGDGAGVTLTSASIVNDGLLSAIAGQVTLNNSGNLSVTGTGTISGLTASFNSTTGSVTAGQATITSTLSGSAQTSFLATATASGLTVDTISATVNTVTLNATGGLFALVDNGSISAGQSVSLTGGTGVSIGNTAQITGGIVGGGLDEFSLDMLAYTYAQIASPGGILITSTTGNIVTGDGVVMNAFGSSIGFTSAGDLTFGNLNTLFSQGANIWMQASDNLTIPDAVIASVARYIPGTVTIDGINTQNFTGGGIAIFAGISLPDYNAYLKTTAVDDRVQSDTGTYINDGATVIGGGAVLTNGAWVGLEAPAGGVLNLTNVVLAADGGVISIDPPGIINITGAIIGAIGPAIIPVPSPPAQQAQQVQAPAAQNPFLGAALPGNGPVNLPPDGTAIQTDVSDFASPVEKNASQVMSRTAQIETVVTQSAAWVFVSGNCQPFLAQSDDSLLFGCGGTMFASNEKTGGVTMREGRLVMLTANKALKLDSQVGDVTIPSDSAGIVEQKPNGVFRLVSLSGQDAQVTLRHGDDISQVAVRPGEELVVADADMSEEDLIPVDGVDRVAIGGTIRISGLQVKKSEYDKKQMFEREQLIHCGMGSTLLSNYKRRVAKLKEEMTGGAGKVISNAPQAPNGNATESNTGVIPLTRKDKEKIGSADVYRKIGYDKSETTQISAPGIRAVTTDFGTFKYVGNTNLAFEQPGVVNLTSGELLVASQKATVVRCADHLISVDPGAVALISNDDGFIRITNLYENSVNAVRACTAGKMISLAAGKQVMFGPTSEHVTRALGADSIARRRSMYFDLPGGKGASRCEVSLVSLLQNTPVLTHLLKSTDSNDQALRERLIKMAACLAQTTSTHGPYTTTNGQH